MLNSTFQNRPRTAELLEGLPGVSHTASIGGSLHKARIVVERNARCGQLSSTLVELGAWFCTEY